MNQNPRTMPTLTAPTTMDATSLPAAQVQFLIDGLTAHGERITGTGDTLTTAEDTFTRSGGDTRHRHVIYQFQPGTFTGIDRDGAIHFTGPKPATITRTMPHAA